MFDRLAWPPVYYLTMLTTARVKFVVSLSMCPWVTWELWDIATHTDLYPTAAAAAAAAAAPLSSIQKPDRTLPTIRTSQDSGGEEEEEEKTVAESSVSEEPPVCRRKLWSRSNSKSTLHSPGSGSGKSFDIQVANWRMESIVRDSDSASEEEFFDCQGKTLSQCCKC